MQHVLRNKNSTIRSSSAQCNIEKEINLHLMLWPGKRQSAAFNPSTTIIIYITTIITTIITSIITSIIIYITSNITTVITIITTTITTIIIYIASSIITVITIITNIIIMIMIFGLGIWFTDKFFLY